jgi:plastocyanin
VVFTNNGRNPHNVLPADDPKATTWGAPEAAFQPKDVYSHVFDRPGTYVYYCSIHGTPTAAMYGTITVTEP